MSSILHSQTIAELSPDVVTFAAEQGVTAYLYPVLEMTGQIFQNCPMTVTVDEDPEIANDRHIVVDVGVYGWDAERMFEGQQRWISEIFQHCPSTLICVFRLAMTDVP
jgi:hypothetical protein